MNRVSLFDRIDVLVVDVALHIVVIANWVFPEPALLDVALTFALMTFPNRLAALNAPRAAGLDHIYRVEKSASPRGNVQIACG